MQRNDPIRRYGRLEEKSLLALEEERRLIQKVENGRKKRLHGDDRREQIHILKEQAEITKSSKESQQKEAQEFKQLQIQDRDHQIQLLKQQAKVSKLKSEKKQALAQQQRADNIRILKEQADLQLIQLESGQGELLDRSKQQDRNAQLELLKHQAQIAELKRNGELNQNQERSKQIELLKQEAEIARLQRERKRQSDQEEEQKRVQAINLLKQQAEVARFQKERELKQQEEERLQKIKLLKEQAEIARLKREEELKKLEAETRRQALILAQQKALQNTIWKLLHEITGNPQNEIRDWLSYAKVLEKESESYQKILKYVNNSQEHGFRLKVTNIIRISRKKENNLNRVQSFEKNRMLLWHGTQKTCVGPIIHEGFRLPQHNGMFGKGIYFADRISKSFQYCRAGTRGNPAHLFLCEVELGKLYNALAAHHYTAAPNNYNSVKGVGKSVPDQRHNDRIDEAVVASGRSIPNVEFPQCSLGFNEYIIYQVERVNPRFLVIVEYAS